MLSTIALALAALLQTAPSTGELHGRVRSEGADTPLPGAVVEVLDAGVPRGVAADDAGAYRLRGVPAGRRRVRARHLGYAPLEMEVVVPAGREVELDVVLRPAPVVLEAVRVDGTAAGRTASDSIPAPRAELAPASARTLDATPGLAELGVAEAARGVPGQEPVDPADILYVRGTGADLKLVYLDGAPVYAPFPLGGLLDAFAPGLLRSADVYLGGAPARYDGGLSYILDLKTRGPNTDRVHSSGALDMLAARGTVETPLGPRLSMLAAGRAVHGVGTERLTRDPLPYGYREGLLRAELEVGRGAVLSVTGFANGERVWLDSTGIPDRVIRWGNSAASARLRAALAATTVEVTASAGDFRAGLPLSGPGVAEGASRRARIAADVVTRDGGLTVRYGISVDRQRQEYRARRGGAGARWVPVGRPGVGDAVGGYLEAGWQVAPRVGVRGGLRADHFSLDSSFRLAPRLSATWLAGERAALTLAAGRYHQYLRPPESQLFGDSSRAVPAALALGSASHLSLALDQELGEGVRLGVEGFYKSFHGVPATQATDANASGVDVWVRRGMGRWTGWMGYSLAWTWSLGEEEAASRFAGRHLLSTGVSAPLGERGRLDLGFTYGAGLPYSAIPFSRQTVAVGLPTASTTFRDASPEGAAGAPPLLPAPTRPYLRLDLAASHTWSRPSMRLTPYLKLLNTLGQRDALFYRSDGASGGRPRALVVLPLVPVLGVEWKM